VTAHITAAGARLLVLHDARMDESSLRSFLHDAVDLYAKALLNPF
jgi:trafficking protein particle complex subunit 2